MIETLEAPEDLFSEVQDSLIDSINTEESVENTAPNSKLYEEITEMIRSLDEKETGIKWQSGDLILSLTEELDKKSKREMFLRIANDTNLEVETVIQYEWLSRKFPEGPIRNISPLLRYSHYRAVATLDDAKDWLERAADEAMTVSKLKEEVATTKQTNDIKLGQPCSRVGCRGEISLESNERVSMQIYGQKLLFCSAACATNTLLNDLNQIKAGILDQPAPPTSSSMLISHPSKKDTIAQEDWESERRDLEKKYFSLKYTKSK